MNASPVTEFLPGVFRIADTCNVYVVRAPGERTAFAVDFGSGRVLDHLGEMGIDRITDVLMTHHHRDQGQGLPRAVAQGIRIHVPPVERDLFADVEGMWQSRTLYNDYNLRQDMFSLVEPVPVHDVVPEYRRRTYAGTSVEVVPTPGHTSGHTAYLLPDAGVLVSGDALVTGHPTTARTGPQRLPAFFDHDPARTAGALDALAPLDADVLLPGHGPAWHGTPEQAVVIAHSRDAGGTW